jgi:hypothetical protein
METSIISRPLIQLAERLGDIPHVQLLRRFAGDVKKGNGRMAQADRYLASLA